MMRSTTPARSLLTALAALLAACADTSVTAPLAGPGGADRAVAGVDAVRSSVTDACPNLAVPAGSKLVLRVYANGVQIYRWNGVAWSFVAPSAVLTADPAGSGIVGTHYAGPTWESQSGSRVAGAVRERCTPDASAIQWLLLDATPLEGTGIFRNVSFIQRINTVGGLAPAAPGSAIDEEARVPYTTEYLFYRSE